MKIFLLSILSGWRITWVLFFVAAMVFVSFPSGAAEPVPAQTNKPNNQQLSNEVQLLRSEIAVFKAKLDENSWKALNITTALSNLQWTLIFFVLTVIGLLGFGGFKVLHDKIYSEVRSSIRLDEDITRTGVMTIAFSKMGFAFWQQYLDLKNIDGEFATTQRARNLTSAIKLGELALEEAKKLETASNAHAKQGDAEREKHTVILTSVRANLAYWLAEEPDPRNSFAPNPVHRERAFNLVREVYSVAVGYMNMNGMAQIERWPDWLDNYSFVLRRYGTRVQKDAATELIKTVCNDPRVSEDWKTWARTEYSLDEDRPATAG